MEKNNKKSWYLNTYLLTVVFSLAWILVSQLAQMTRQLDFGWEHMFLNIPLRLSVFFPSCDSNPNACLFGKYFVKDASDKVTITAIDDYTYGKLGYPFKRKYYGVIIDKLKSYGVKAVGMDVLFFEPDKDNPENDKIFAEASARAGNVVNLVSVDKYTHKLQPTLPFLPEVSAVMAHPHVDITQDVDGQVRRYSPFYPGYYSDDSLSNLDLSYITYSSAGLKKVKCWNECKDVPIPSLGIAPYAVMTGNSLSDLSMTYSSERLLNYRTIVSRRAHPAWNKDPQDLKTSSFRHISVMDIINGTLSPEEKAALKDGVTFLGSTALAAFDHTPSPFSPQFPGVEVHATFLDNLLAGDFRSPLPSIYAMLLILALPWVPVVLRKYSITALVSVNLGVMALLFVSYVLLLKNNVSMPFPSIFLSIFMPFAYITVDKGLAESREKKWIKGTFGQYLSPKVVEMVTKDPSKLSLGGEKRDMTAFFLDLAGFTTMSEKLSPEELTAMLVEYLSAFTDVIMKHDGTVDKYIGDCVVAFWNAPMDQADHRVRGVLAAIDCQKEMTRLNEALTQFTIKPKCRVGVNSGPMVVGNMGSRQRLSYTVMGDSVNMASRMEGANKFFHSKIMTSEHTFGEIKDKFDYRYLGSIRVVGKAIPTKVYEPFERKGQAPADIQAMLTHYNAGLDKFYKGDFAGSVDHFKAALLARPGDGPAEFYVEKAELFAKQPIKDWDQSFNLTEKG